VAGRSTRSLEGIETVPNHQRRRLMLAFGSVVMFALGLCLVGLALFMLLPVAVNFPESWLGAVEMLLSLGVGVALIYASWKSAQKAGSSKVGSDAS
jgi:hypothetical protein